MNHQNSDCFLYPSISDPVKLAKIRSMGEMQESSRISLERPQIKNRIRLKTALKSNRLALEGYTCIILVCPSTYYCDYSPGNDLRCVRGVVRDSGVSRVGEVTLESAS